MNAVLNHNLKAADLVSSQPAMEQLGLVSGSRTGEHVGKATQLKAE